MALRLRRRRDFLAAAGGRRFHTDRLTAQGRIRDPDETRGGAPVDGLHVGFTITKRVGHATERNRIRRRLRRAVEIASGDMAGVTADVVVIARRPALDAGFDSLVDDLRRAIAVVTKPRKPAGSSGRATPGGGHRQASHRARRQPATPQSTIPHGPTDGQ